MARCETLGFSLAEIFPKAASLALHNWEGTTSTNTNHDQETKDAARKKKR